ncbi:MAG: hypothetical protein ACOCZ8_06035 [Bacteroidota bacterium]
MAEQSIHYDKELGFLRLAVSIQQHLPDVICECYLDPMSLNTRELVVLEIIAYTGDGIFDNSFANQYGKLAMLKSLLKFSD